MRVEGSARTLSEANGAARFGDALARAERAGRDGRNPSRAGEGRAVEARAQEARAMEARATDARAAGARGSRSPSGTADPRRPGAAGESTAPGGEEPRVAPRPAGAGGGEGAPPEVGPVAELARVARALPVAIASLGPPGSAPLALSFGRSLDVELRPTAAGIDVVLRPEPRLARAAEAELPRLVAALRGRGISVASAAVRPRGPPEGRAR